MSTLPSVMRAVRVHEFGGINELRLEQMPLPLPSRGQVLVEVHAAGVGPWDAWVRAGKSALKHKLPLTPGSDISGTIAALGDSVSSFGLGDAIYGVTNAEFTGGYAQFALAEVTRIAAKPATIGFIEAAAVPVVAVTAWTMTKELGELKTGERVLVHGGAGNVGAFAVQFAKRLGAHVIATGLATDMATLSKLGADQMIDVGTTDFTSIAGGLDLVVDTVGGDTQNRSFEVLREGGRLVSSVSQPDLARASAMGVTARYFIVDVTAARLQEIAGQIDGLRILVGDVLRLGDVRLAHEMLAGKPHEPGKIVLDVKR